MVVDTRQSEGKLGLRILETAKKLKENGSLFDCSVKVGAKKFPAHSLLLAASSEYFQKQISAGENEIILEGVKSESVGQCMGLIYGEHDDDLEGNIDDILRVSSMVKFNGVQDFCFDLMEENMSVQNCFTTVERARLYRRIEVYESAEKFIAENFEDVVETAEFLLISKDDLLHYIYISKANYQVVWKAVIRWIEGKQIKLLPKLMDAIHIEYFPIEFLMKTVWKERRVQDTAKGVVTRSLFSELKRLKESLCIDNCFFVKSFNQAHNTLNNQAVKITVTVFMGENLSKIKDKEEFMLMDVQDLTEIIQASELPPAIEKWAAVIDWIKHVSNRRIYFSQLVDVLHIETFAFVFLLGVIWEEPLVQKSEELKRKIAKIALSSNHNIEDDINVDNCFCLTNMNLKYNSVNCLAVKEILRSFMARNFERIFEKREYLKLEKDDIACIIKNVKANVRRKWQGLMKWINYEKSRADCFQEMTNALNFREFSLNFLLDHVYTAPLVQKSESIRLQVIHDIFSDLQRLEQNIAKGNCLALKIILNETQTGSQYIEAKNIVNRHVTFNLESAIVESEFPSLGYDGLVSILQSPESCVLSNATKWESVLRWVKHEKTREVYLPRLLDILTFEDTFLLRVIWKEPLVQDCEAAKVFVITRLFCNVTKLLEIITMDNCFFIADVNKKASSLNYEEVRKALVDFMAKNFDKILEKQEFMVLTKDDIVSMLETTTTTEMEKWQAMIKWIKFDKSRERCLEKMMRDVKLNECSIDFLLQTVCNEPLVQSSDSVKSTVVKFLLSESNAIPKCGTEKVVSLGRLSKQPGFFRLGFNDLTFILKAPDAAAQPTKMKWKAVTRWLKHDSNRNLHIPKLLDIFKIQDFPSLITTMWRSSFVQSSEEAKMLVVNSLFSDLVKLEENINIDNCFQIKDLNDTYNRVNRDDAGKLMIHFMMQHFEDTVRKKEFLNFDVHSLMKLIKTPDRRVSLEVKFEVIVKWVNHNGERKEVFPQLLKHLDLNAMHTEYVRNVVMEEPLVMNSQECLIHLCLPDRGQHPNFAIFEGQMETKLSVLNMEGRDNFSNLMPFGNHGSFHGMVTVGGEAYLITDKKIMKLQSDGKAVTLQNLRNVLPDSEVTFQKKIYIIQPRVAHTICFDPADNSLIDDLPGSGLGPGSCATATEDFIYVMGGVGTQNRAKRFDPRSKTWTEIADMKKARCYAAAATLDSEIYVMGQPGNAAVERYCPESNSWIGVSNMNASRRFFDACAFEDRLYAVGGDRMKKTNGKIEDSIEVYHKKLDRWIMVRKFETADWSRSFACIWPYEPSKPVRVSSRDIRDYGSQQAAGHATISEGGDDARGKDERHDKLSEEMNRQIKTKSLKSKIIGAYGGSVKNFGWTVTFLPNAFDKDTEVVAAVITDLSDCPEGKMPITSIIECSPPGRLSRSALLEVEHWAFPTEDDIPVYAELHRKESGETDWQFVKKIRIFKNQKISFNADHFTLYELVVECATWLWSGIKQPFVKVTLQNLVYISGIDQSVACVCFVKDKKVRNDVLQLMEKSGYRSILPLPTTVYTCHDKRVKLGIKCVCPQNMQILENDEDGNVFGQQEIEKEFHVKNILNTCAETHTLPIRLQNANLKEFDGVLTFSYSHATDGEDNVRHILQIVWPIPGADPTHITTVHNYGPIRTNTIAGAQ